MRTEPWAPSCGHVPACRGMSNSQMMSASRAVSVPNPSLFVVRVLRDEVRAADDQRRAAVGGHVPGFILEGPIVAVGHALDVETHDLVAIRDGVDAVALHRRRRADARLGPIEIRIRPELGHDQLPQEVAVLLVEAQQHAAVALMTRIAGRIVVGPNEHPPLGHHRRGPGLAAQRHDPLDVPARGRVEAVHQARLAGDHVAREGLAPLGLVTSVNGR